MNEEMNTKAPKELLHILKEYGKSSNKSSDVVLY